MKVRAQEAEYLLNCIAHYKLISEDIDAATNSPANDHDFERFEGVIEGLDIAAEIIKGRYNGNPD